MRPFLSLCIGPTAGWAVRYRNGRVDSGDVSLRANPMVDVLDPAIGHWWLNGIRKTLPFFDVIGIVDPPKPYPQRFAWSLEDWLAMTGAHRVRITPREYKRAVVGPYCTIRELLAWAKSGFPKHAVQSAQQAAALAGLSCLPAGDVPIAPLRRARRTDRGGKRVDVRD